MANKREKEKRIRESLAMEYEKSITKHLQFYCLGIAILLLVIICYLFNWVYIYNSDYGIEAKASGFSFIAAALSNNYSSATKIYGDLSVPFYYYAKNSCESLGIVTLLSFLLNITTIIVLVIIRITKLFKLTFVSISISLVSSILLVLAFIISICMKNDKILSIYCGGNPKCYIGSLSIFAALLSFFDTIIQIIGLKKILVLNSNYYKKVKQL